MAEDALAALEADEDATPAQIATAEAAVLTAEEAVAKAEMAHDDYLATTPDAIMAAAAEAKERAEGTRGRNCRRLSMLLLLLFDPASVTATHDGDAAKVTVTAALKYAKQDTGPAPIEGWDGSKWSKDDTKSTEHVTIYSNIAAPSPVAFTEGNGADVGMVLMIKFRWLIEA